MGYADLIERADRAALDHLGSVTVTYAPEDEDEDPVEVDGIFDENYVLLSPHTSAVEQSGPAVWLRLEDLPTDPREEEPTLTIDGVDYQVRERIIDSIGGIRLLLHRKPAED